MNALQEYSVTGNHANVDFEGKIYTPHYHTLLENLLTFEAAKPAECHLLQERLAADGG